MRKLRPVILPILLTATLAVSIPVYQTESKKRELKEDLIELSKVKYGMFNVDEWKEALAGIISKKVEEFNLEDTNKDELREKISTFLYVVIDDFEENFRETNRKKSWFGLSYKNLIASSVDLFARLKENVPEITDQIIDFFQNPENREKVKAYIIGKLNEYADRTFSSIDYSEHDTILMKHGYSLRIDTIPALETKIQDLNNRNRIMYIGLYVLIFVLGLFLAFSREISKTEFTFFVILSFIVLSLGLLLPMIDIDARISQMKFQLLGESIQFEDQVLYYKSKSILEVVQLMLTQGKVDLFVVGFLVLLFSVLFPVSKLVCSLILLYSKERKNLKWANIIVFKTGKWSMADVMVIAIFMAYIGFTGILTEQLRQLEDISATVDILTTNQSRLQLGFFMFTAFVLLSLLISQRMGKIISPSR